ncbi:hypothetical protein L1887_25496 [Cichorium endivia]|nr:hypothetical protein L1887_25496 [Cichorium endivia]
MLNWKRNSKHMLMTDAMQKEFGSDEEINVTKEDNVHALGDMGDPSHPIPPLPSRAPRDISVPFYRYITNHRSDSLHSPSSYKPSSS